VRFHGNIDYETGTVSFGGVGLDFKEFSDAFAWLSRVHRWMVEADIEARGGNRWEFAPAVDGALPIATLMRGGTLVASLHIVRITPRRHSRCASCGMVLEPGVSCWKQGPGQHSGHSADRFCERCVEDGCARRAPKLQLVMGGVE